MTSGEVKITEKEVAELLRDEAHILVTQTETVDGKEMEALRRMPLQKFRDKVVEDLPIEVTEDGYTDFTGLRQVIGPISVVKTDDSTITITYPLEGGESIEEVITLGGDGYPSTITVDGRECHVTWEGF